ncbi:hypothetical protein ACW7G0_12020 [Lysobacter sp. A286]
MDIRSLTPLTTVLCAAVLAVAVAPANAQSADDYAGMLDYLANSRIDGQAFDAANGAIAVNLAAGDFNQQANLRSFSSGERADSQVVAVQKQTDNQYDMPVHAAASIGGGAFHRASGLVSINQASGSGNAELNVVTAALANQGIRETTDGGLSSVVLATAGGQPLPDSNVARTGTRSVAVESTALQGFEGVLQLNQIAGSGNSISNQFGLSVHGGP